MVEEGGALGVEEMVLGMPHRGRVNVLGNVLGKPYEMLLAEFEGTSLAKEATGDGDVKYHLGYSRETRRAPGGPGSICRSRNRSISKRSIPSSKDGARHAERLVDTVGGRVVPVLI